MPPAEGPFGAGPEILARLASPDDVPACIDLADAVLGGRRAGPFVQAALDRQQLVVAATNGEIVGILAYRTDWFACTLITLVNVHPDHRRRGVARALYREVEAQSPSPRLFSSTEETNVAAIRLHRALGFVMSGYVDNLPQGYRELLFYKRLRPAS